MFAAYLVGLEILLRMTRSGLPHEFGKYAVSLILLAGVMADRDRRPKAAWPWLYLLLLVPSIPLVFDGDNLERSRQLISANLSGPFSLFAAALYFANRRTTLDELRRISVVGVLPVITLSAYLFLNTKSAENIDFRYGANFATTLYGSNQVSTTLGFGVLLIGLFLVVDRPLFRPKFVNYAICGMFFYRGLLSFSRGGMMVPLAALAIALLVRSAHLGKNTFRKAFASIAVLTAMIVLGTVLWNRVDAATGGALEKRYLAFFQDDVSTTKYLSGRDKIAEIDLQIFADNPVFGIGPGMASTERVKYGYPVTVAAHVEQSRLVAEHGVFGGLCVVLLCLAPARQIQRTRASWRPFPACLAAYAVASMLHSAMRLSIVGYVFGLAFAHLYEVKPKPGGLRKVARRRYAGTDVLSGAPPQYSEIPGGTRHKRK